jgi:hypothetical protein
MVAFAPSLVITVEADTNVNVCIEVSAAILNPFSVMVAIDVDASTANFGKYGTLRSLLLTGTKFG